jgi:hypothetical protein
MNESEFHALKDLISHKVKNVQKKWYSYKGAKTIQKKW